VWVAARGASWSTHHETAAAQKTINFSKGNRKKIIETTTAQKEKKSLEKGFARRFAQRPIGYDVIAGKSSSDFFFFLVASARFASCSFG